MQLDIFETLYKPLPKVNHIKLGTFFSGIGSPEKALKRIGMDYELMFFSEIDKYAIQSYCQIHNEDISKNKGDITKIKGKDLPYADLWFGGFPCQDISLAGKRKGWEKDTRSSLGWEMIRLLDEVKEKPKYVIFENVANIMSEPMRPTLNLFKQDLEDRGYTLYNEILNAKDYGMPQNRERYFLVAILGGYYYRFPPKQELKLKLKDMLEDEVDEKYYLSENAIKGMLETNYQQNKYETRVQGDIAGTLCARDWKDPKCVEVFDFRYDEGVRGRTEKDICPTLTLKTGTTGISGQPLLKIPEATKKGYALATDGDGVYINRPQQKRGVVQKGKIQTLKTSCDDVGVVVKGNYSPSNHNASRIVDSKGIAPTVMENHGTVTAIVEEMIKNNNAKAKHQQDMLQHQDGNCRTIPAGSNASTPHLLKTVVNDSPLRIRKLTPKECWRLMGFDDEDYSKASQVCSNSQLYKQAGNSIVVNVLEAIFKELLGGD